MEIIDATDEEEKDEMEANGMQGVHGNMDRDTHPRFLLCGDMDVEMRPFFLVITVIVGVLLLAPALAFIAVAATYNPSFKSCDDGYTIDLVYFLYFAGGLRSDYNSVLNETCPYNHLF